MTARITDKIRLTNFVAVDSSIERKATRHPIESWNKRPLLKILTITCREPSNHFNRHISINGLLANAILSKTMKNTLSEQVRIDSLTSADQTLTPLAILVRSSSPDGDLRKKNSVKKNSKNVNR
jgi:hypothetical protein